MTKTFRIFKKFVNNIIVPERTSRCLTSTTQYIREQPEYFFPLTSVSINLSTSKCRVPEVKTDIISADNYHLQSVIEALIKKFHDVSTGTGTCAAVEYLRKSYANVTV